MFTTFWTNHEDKIKSIIIGAGISAVGAGATVLLEAATKADFGDWTAIVVATCSILANVLRKFGIPVLTSVVASIKGNSVA